VSTILGEGASMMEEALPTRDSPRHIGRHRVYYHADSVMVVIYSGDLGPDELRAIVKLRAESGRRSLASVVDVGELGSFGPETRKVFLSDSATKLLASETVPLGLFVVNADVVRRAVMKLAMLAARVLSKRAQRVFFVSSREEGERRAAAYHARFAGVPERPRSDVSG